MSKLSTVFVFSKGTSRDGKKNFQKCVAVIFPGVNDKQKTINCRFWDDATKGEDPYHQLIEKGLIKDMVGTIEMTVDYSNKDRTTSQQYLSDQKDSHGNKKCDKDGNPYKQLNIKYLSEDVHASDFKFTPKSTLEQLGIDDTLADDSPF